jgi:hypothetical protein
MDIRRVKEIIKEWMLEGLNNTNILEEEYFIVNEIKIDPLNSYEYEETNFLQGKGGNKAWMFEDRCGNVIYAVYNPNINEFKTGFKVEEVDTLIFQPERFPMLLDKIKPCPDDKKIGTIYKILTQEIISQFLLNKKPNKLYFNPVSSTRDRLTQIIINKLISSNPQLTQKGNYLIHI